MRDGFIILFLVALTVISFVRPWLMTFTYLYVDLIQPQRISYGLLNTVPISLLYALLAVLFFLFDPHKKLRIGATQILMLLFIVWFTLTSSWALLPDSQVWVNWGDAWKAVGFGAFLPLVLTTRRRLEGVLALAVACIAVVTISAGMKTLSGGGGYGQLSMIVNVNKGLYESSTISTVGIAALPIAIYLREHSPLVGRTLLTLLVVLGLCFAAVLTVIGTEARTGLVCIAVFAAMLWFRSRHKLPIAAAAVALGILSLPLLPPAFTARMSTILRPSEDVSASTRTQMWRWTWKFAKAHPFGGGFRVFRLSSVQVFTPERDRMGNLTGRMRSSPQVARAFHSSYFQVLGEQGFPGLLIYLSIIGSALFTLARLRARTIGGAPEDAWIASLARALFRTIVIFSVGSLFVALSLQTTLYLFIAFAVSLGHIVAAQRASGARRRMAARRGLASQPQLSGAFAAGRGRTA